MRLTYLFSLAPHSQLGAVGPAEVGGWGLFVVAQQDFAKVRTKTCFIKRIFIKLQAPFFLSPQCLKNGDETAKKNWLNGSKARILLVSNFN